MNLSNTSQQINSLAVVCHVAWLSAQQQTAVLTSELAVIHQ